MSDGKPMVVRGVKWGAVFLLGAVAGIGSLIVVPTLTGSNNRPQIRAEIVGADVSAHGGSRIFLQHEAGVFEQQCNGVCDDW